MKKQIIATIAKLTLATFFVVSVTTTTQAQKTITTPAEKTVNVKYVGNEDGMVLFNVTYDNPSGNKFAVIVYDKANNQLFQEAYFDKKFDRKFKFIAQESNKLTFIIRSYKDADIAQSFEVNTHVVEDVVVTKL